ncbi:MAG: hypothetical protein LBK60_00465 [Verrucomicrobiales bacterium]|jgi:hypothetical protein|nr:hypothetical protein [Verrucomicrobiales bacterium]
MFLDCSSARRLFLPPILLWEFAIARIVSLVWVWVVTVTGLDSSAWVRWFCVILICSPMRGGGGDILMDEMGAGLEVDTRAVRELRRRYH